MFGCVISLGGVHELGFFWCFLNVFVVHFRLQFGIFKANLLSWLNLSLGIYDLRKFRLLKLIRY